MRYLLLLAMSLMTMAALGCTTARRVVGGLIETTDYNRGTLVGVPSMSLQEIREKSTFNLGKGFVSTYSTSKEEFLSRSYRFDWQLPNSQIKFKDCAGYTIRTDDETGERVVRMQMFTGRKYFTWSEVKAEAYQVEQMLINDGWQSSIDPDGSPSSKLFHAELEKPNFHPVGDDEITGVSYRKNGVSFSFYIKIGRNRGKTDVGDGENFTHYAILSEIAYRDRHLQTK